MICGRPSGGQKNQQTIRLQAPDSERALKRDIAAVGRGRLPTSTASGREKNDTRGGETACSPAQAPGYSRHRSDWRSVVHQPTPRWVAALLPLACHLTPLFAQTWNDSAATALVQRAIARRQVVQADSALQSYQTQAHGFVFFLAQVGEHLAEPPRLIK